MTTDLYELKSWWHRPTIEAFELVCLDATGEVDVEHLASKTQLAIVTTELGRDTSFAAALCALLTKTDAASVTSRVIVDGRIDHNAWMTQCRAIQDAIASLPVQQPEIGDLQLADAIAHQDSTLANAVAFLQCAIQNEVPVLIDGPDLAVALLVVARETPDFANTIRPLQTGVSAIEHQAHDYLRLQPVLDVRAPSDGRLSDAAVALINAAAK